MKLELELDGERKRQFEYLLESAETGDGSDVGAEELAEKLLSQAVITQYMSLFSDRE